MKLIKKEHILTISMLIGAAAAIILGSFTVFAKECEDMPQRLFRLHILANSDSEEDQQLKYDLRDYLLQDMSDIFKDCQSATQAKFAAKENLSQIAEKSALFVKEKGYDYKVTASVENIYFTTRRYGSTVVPAGNYDSLRIVIGEGEGHNWWCVMFPPLCLGAVEEYVTSDEDLIMCRNKVESSNHHNVSSNSTISNKTSRIIEQDQPVEVRFALFEWIEKLFN